MIPPEFQEDADAMPPLLRGLLDAELKAGNTIESVSHTFPAPPRGAAFLMSRPITTRPRTGTDGFVFRERNHSSYHGSFTDADGNYFLLEPPVPYEYPEMDAIREAVNKPREEVKRSSGSALVDEFRASMNIDYGKWRDGEGYNVELIKRATEEEKSMIFDLLPPPTGWRDIEALAALDTYKARVTLRDALRTGNAEVRLAVTNYAPNIVSKENRLATLLYALKHAEPFAGLSGALDQVEQYHPKEVVDELFRGLFSRPGDVACNFAGMLTFLHGKGDSAFDWTHRPLFLKFNTDDGAGRREAFQELCVLLELDPEKILKRIA